jgi:hypothetical protein
MDSRRLAAAHFTAEDHMPEPIYKVRGAVKRHEVVHFGRLAFAVAVADAASAAIVASLMKCIVTVWLYLRNGRRKCQSGAII